MDENYKNSLGADDPNIDRDELKSSAEGAPSAAENAPEGFAEAPGNSQPDAAFEETESFEVPSAPEPVFNEAPGGEEDNGKEADGECSHERGLDETNVSLNELKAAGEAVSGKLDELSKQVAALSASISRFSSYDTAVETLKQSLAVNKSHEDKLYKEVEEYKKGTYFTNIRPFLNFLIDTLCELKKSKNEYLTDREQFIEENNEAVWNEIVNLLDFYINSIEGQLKVQNVTVTAYEPDTDYISGSQRITKTVKTDDPEKNGKIAQALSDCYSYEKTVLRPAAVTVYKA